MDHPRRAFVLFLLGIVLALPHLVFAQTADLQVRFHSRAPFMVYRTPQDWTLVVENLGPSPASQVQLIFDVGGPVQFLSVDPADSCVVSPIPGGQEWVCSLGTIAPGDSARVVWEVQSTDVGPPLELSWSVSAAEKDPDPTNNQGHQVLPLRGNLDFDLQLSGSFGSVVLARSLDIGTHFLQVYNNGPEVAYGVALTDSFPPGWTIGSVSAEGFGVTSTIDSSVVRCCVDSIPVGTSASFKIEFDPGGEGWARIGSTVEGYGNDLAPADNARSDSVLVLPPPDYIVNTTDDLYDGVCDSVHCSLREALTLAGWGSIIAFRIPGPAPYRIQPQTPYPYIRTLVTIDGWYQPGFAGTPLVEIDGSQEANPYSDAGLTFRTGANFSMVRGIVMGGFPTAISVGAPALTVEGCYLGVAADGATPRPNLHGIQGPLEGCRIGGSTPWQRNVISGNSGFGIWVVGQGFGRIIGNYIGTDASGMIAVPNLGGGISIDGGGGLWVGGLDPAEGNLISGNGDSTATYHFGIDAHGTVSATLHFANNWIGVDASGQAALPNQGPGLVVRGAGMWTGQRFYEVGLPGAGNLVSGNLDVGIEASAVFTSLLDNRVGVSADGTLPIPNYYGIQVKNYAVRVGEPGAGNLIGASISTAISLTTAADACTLQANRVGVDWTDQYEFSTGPTFISGPDSVVIGGAGPGEGNVFPSLQVSGMHYSTIQGNIIGLHGDGTTPFTTPPSVALFFTGTQCRVGGPNPGEGNVIGGATSFGVDITASQDVTLEGNWIGVAADGSTPVPNGQGIRVFNQIYQLTLGSLAAGNHIAYNTSTGILFTGGDYTGVEVVGNQIHDNGGDGIWVSKAWALDGWPYGSVWIHQNAIYANQELGIDLGNNGVDPSDNLDLDEGDNGQQNAPEITSAQLTGDSLLVTVFLSSSPDADFQIDLYLNRACDPSAGEGESYLGTLNLHTLSMGGGAVRGAFYLVDHSLPHVTATATDSLGQTSEFSPCVIMGGVTGVETPARPLQDRLLAPYPNPFNPRATIRWEQARAARVELTLYDRRGRRVVTLAEKEEEAGTHRLIWNGTDGRGRPVASGIYFLRLRLDGADAGGVQRLVLLK